MSAGVLVWSEEASLSRDLVGAARRLSDRREQPVVVVVAVAAGADAAERTARGAGDADTVYLVEGVGPDAAGWVDALEAVVAASGVRLVLIGGSKVGLAIAPRLAERLEAGYVAWAVDLGFTGGDDAIEATCMIYGGAGLATHRLAGSLAVATAAEGALGPPAAASAWREARVENVAVRSAPSPLTLISEQAKADRGERIEDAKVVVDVGRGVKDTSGLDQARRLASLLGGQVGCSRPVSSERDWLPEWLGLSGAKVRPDLCLALGISGSVQHIIGIRESRVVATVNNDEEAAIFAQADVGAVIDLEEFVPALIRRLEERGAKLASQ